MSRSDLLGELTALPQTHSWTEGRERGSMGEAGGGKGNGGCGGEGNKLGK